MAKKATKKTGNILFDILILLLAGGIFGFLALPYMSSKATVFGKEVVSNISGYDLLNFDANSGIATVILLLVIFASLLALFAIVKILADLGMFKNKKASRLLSFIVILLALAVFAMTITNMIYIPTECNSGSLGSYFAAGTYPAWLGLILTAVDSLLALVTSLFTLKK